MKNRLLAYCGLDCENCEARKATLDDNDALRVEVARKWCEWNHTADIKPEHINCLGCRTDGLKTVYCSSLCGIRKCASAKGVETCADCSVWTSCPTLAPIVSTNAAAAENLRQ